MNRIRMSGAVTAFLLFSWLILAAPQLAHAEKTFEGGAHIWLGQDWGEFRVHVGPRYAWGNFSIHPQGALGMAFLSGVDSRPASIGAYSDFDYAIPVESTKAFILGVGGGGGHIFGLHSVHGYVLPQGYGHLVYKWEGNLVGLMGLWGPSYSVPDEGFPIGFPEKLRFSGIGLRFEYVID